jgi:hypothetical protein
MAFVHGSNAVLVLDGTTVSTYTDQCTVTRNGETADVTAFGNDDRAFIAGLRNATLDFAGHYDAAYDSALAGALDQASIAWSFSPDAGTTTYSGNGFLTSYSVAASVGDKVSINGSLQVTGAVSRA